MNHSRVRGRDGVIAQGLPRGLALVGCMAMAGVMSLAGAVHAQFHEGRELVRAQLVADVASYTPGRPITLGLVLDIEPLWHVYWINPGDSGQAPELSVSLPDGWTSGNLLFPTPISFTQPGDLIGYGYESRVVLLKTITPPASASGPVTIKADASWLVCSDICIPGGAALSITLPQSQEPAPSHDVATINSAKAAMPVVMGASTPVNTAQTTHVREGDWIRVTTRAGLADAGRVKAVEFFPATPSWLNLTEPAARVEGDAVVVSFKAKPFGGQSPAQDSMQGLVVITTDQGRDGVSIDIPLGWAGQTQH